MPSPASHAADVPSPTALIVSRGLPDGVTRSRLRGKAFERVTRDLYVPAGTLSDLTDRCRAVLPVLPEGAAFCLATAAALSQLPLPVGWNPHEIHVAVPNEVGLPRRGAIVSHQWQLPPEQIRTVKGLPVVSAARTWLELTSRTSLEDVVAFGDAALRAGTADETEVVALVAASGRRRGVVLARRAVGMLDRRAEAPTESRVRVWMQLAGLPRATPNLWICDRFGRPFARGDLVVEDFATIVEYEGSHHRDAEQFSADLRRRNQLQELGFRVVHLEKSLLTSRHEVVRTIVAVLRLQGWVGDPDFTFSSDWTQGPNPVLI